MKVIIQVIMQVMNSNKHLKPDMAQTKAFIVQCTIMKYFCQVKITLSYISICISIVQSILSYSKIIIFLFTSRSVICFLRRCIHIVCTAYDLLCRRISKIKTAIIPASMSYNDTKVSLFHSISGGNFAWGILYNSSKSFMKYEFSLHRHLHFLAFTFHIGTNATCVGILSNVCILSSINDVFLIDCLLLGRGEFTFNETILLSTSESFLIIFIIY